jgi:hypothetical protein
VIPPRPLGPSSWMTNLPRSLDSASVSQHTSQVYHPHYLNHTQRYASPMLNTSGLMTNPLDTTYGVFGEMIYARIFGNQVTNIYTYPNSYNLSGISNPRMRRHLMRADRSLGRICFFLFCCAVLCLLLFWMVFHICCAIHPCIENKLYAGLVRCIIYIKRSCIFGTAEIGYWYNYLSFSSYLKWMFE